MTRTPRHRRPLIAAAIGVLAVVLTACGASAPTVGGTGSSGSGSKAGGSSSGTIPTSCALLTPARAETVLGKPVKKTREAKPNAHMTQCQYSGPKAFADVLSGDCPFMKQFAAPSGGKPVSGVGDSATADATQLFACKGNLGLEITIGIVGSYSGKAATDVEAKQLALEKKLATELFAAS